MAQVLFVIPPERFRDEELFVTQAVLLEAGHDVLIGSTSAGRCPGSRGGSVEATLMIQALSGGDFDAVVFIGGGGSKLLWENSDALRLAIEAHEAGRVLGAICLAPVILANASVLAGRRATVAGTQAAAIEAAGATYTGPGVTVDGAIVTANGPKSSRLFAEALVLALEETG